MACYCKDVKLFLEDTKLKKLFAYEYSKAIQIKSREDRARTRAEDIQEANANLIHKGQMLMYSAADHGYYEISSHLLRDNLNLERHKVDEEGEKGKRKATANLETDKGKKIATAAEEVEGNERDESLCHINLIQTLKTDWYERQTADAKLMILHGCELGAVEIKPFNTPSVDIEIDLVHPGEITKRMLHLRIIKAKSTKEFKTFGIQIYGSIADYYIHEYHHAMPTTPAATLSGPSTVAASTGPSTASPAEETLSGSYTFTLIHRSTLPTLPSTYTHMMLSLECLTYFKKIMQDSLAADSEIDEPYVYDDILEKFLPTVTLLKFE